MRYRVFGILIAFFVLFSMVPTFYELSRIGKLPPDRSFELVHNYVTDYNFYLSRIREGWDGRWTAIERYTAERHDGSYIQIFYLLLGQAVRGISDSSAATQIAYHTARALLAAVLLWTIAAYARRLFPVTRWAVIAFLLAVTASTWPKLVWIAAENSWRFGGFMPWFTVVDSLQRTTFLPHILAAQAIMAFIFMTSGNRVALGNPWSVVFMGISEFVLAVVFPPGAVFVAAVLMVHVALDALADRVWGLRGQALWTWVAGMLAPRTVVAIAALPSVIYFSLMLTMYPWKRLIEFETINPTKYSLVEYALALGPTLPLGALGLMFVFGRKARSMYGVAAWVVTWAACMVVFHLLPGQSPLRFTEMAPHVPLGFLTAYLFVVAIRWIGGFRLPSAVSVGIGAIVFGISFVPVVLGLGTMYSSWLWQKDFVDMKVRAGWPRIAMNNYIVYPAKGFMEAISYINWVVPKDAVIVSDLTAGNYIPAYAGRTVFVGHDNTVAKEQKRRDVQSFFRGQMTQDEAYGWLKRVGATHVFWGPQEKEYNSGVDLRSMYPFLIEKHANTDASVYALP